MNCGEYLNNEYLLAQTGFNIYTLKSFIRNKYKYKTKFIALRIKGKHNTHKNMAIKSVMEYVLGESF